MHDAQFALLRAALVSRPEEYRWSSYRANAWVEPNWLQGHVEYVKLGSTSEARACAYRELFRTELGEKDLHLIRNAAHYCQPVGDDRFAQQIAQRYGIRPGHMKRGRPRGSTAGVIKV